MAEIIKAAGVLLRTKGGKILFLKRAPGGDMPGLWCFPGGRLEGEETEAQAAARECAEECGLEVDLAKLRPWTRSISPRQTTGPAPTPVVAGEVAVATAPGAPGSSSGPLPGPMVDFTTYVLDGVEEFAPKLGPSAAPEQVAYAWAPGSEPPEPLHPGCRVALARFAMDELGVARAMSVGDLTSPQKYGNVWLYDLRITGTGVSYRGKVDEFVYRRPENYLTPEFLARCNGLQVIMLHPKGAILNSKEFSARTVGSMMLPYLGDGRLHPSDEVWGVAKIYDEDAVKLLLSRPMSTSPAVLLGNGDQKLKLEDGSDLLIEGKPSLLDHLAICERGVWDKGGEPSGVRNDSQGDKPMTEDEKKALDKQIADAVAASIPGAVKTAVEAARADDAGAGQKLDKLLSGLDSLGKRMDAADKREDSRRKADAFRFTARKDDDDDASHAKRHDAEEKALCDALEAAGEPKEVAADKARRRRKDAEEEDRKARDDAGHRKLFSKRRDDDDDDSYKRRHDAEEETAKADAMKRGDAEEKAKADAARARKDAEEEEAKEREDKAKKDAEERAKADAAVAAANPELARRIAAVEKALPKQLTDADRHAFAQAQARADDVYSAFGKRAPYPLNGEDVAAYRRRLIHGLKPHSDPWKAVDVMAIADEATFKIAEDAVLKDAAVAARNPVDLPENELREITRVDSSTGVRTTEFRGRHSFVSAMKRPPRYVTRIGVRKEA